MAEQRGCDVGAGRPVDVASSHSQPLRVSVGQGRHNRNHPVRRVSGVALHAAWLDTYGPVPFPGFAGSRGSAGTGISRNSMNPPYVFSPVG